MMQVNTGRWRFSMLISAQQNWYYQLSTKKKKNNKLWHQRIRQPNSRTLSNKELERLIIKEERTGSRAAAAAWARTGETVRCVSSFNPRSDTTFRSKQHLLAVKVEVRLLAKISGKAPESFA